MKQAGTSEHDRGCLVRRLSWRQLRLRQDKARIRSGTPSPLPVRSARRRAPQLRAPKPSNGKIHTWGACRQRILERKIELSLKGAIERGLRYNLGLIESKQASAEVRAERLRALSALLPQLSAGARQGCENLSLKEIGLKLPSIPGLPSLPSTTGAFGYGTPGSASNNLFITQNSEISTALARAMNRRQRSASRIPAM